MTASPAQNDLWLAIRDGARQRFFLFEKGDEQPIVVGGGASAAFRIPDTAPICLHFERINDDLVVVPGYVRHLRINGEQISDPTRLPGRAFMAFGSHRLDISVRTVSPSDEELEASQEETAPDEDDAPTAPLSFTDAMVTRAITAPIVEQGDEMPTVAMEIPETTAIPPRPQTQNEIETQSAPLQFSETFKSQKRRVGGAILGPANDSQADFDSDEDDEDPALVTQMMGSLPDMDEIYPGHDSWSPRSIAQDDPTPLNGRPQKKHQDANEAPLVAETPVPRILAPKQNQSVAEPITDRTEGIPFEDFVPPSGTHQAVYEPASSRSPASQETATPAGERAPAPAAEPRTRPGPKELLEKLGVLAKEKPVLALGGGLAAALLLGLATAGITKVVSPGEESTRPSLQIQSAQASKDRPEGEPSPDRTPENSEASAAPSTPPPTNNAPQDDRSELMPVETKEPNEDPKQALDRAVRHLIAGRNDEAIAAYKSLASDSSAPPELRRTAEILELATSPLPENSQRPKGLPEILR